MASGEMSEADMHAFTSDDAPDRWKPLKPEEEDQFSHISPPLAWVYLQGVGNLCEFWARSISECLRN